MSDDRGSRRQGLPVILLCGGRGVRAYPDTAEIPKPLLEVGGIPLVEHVMAIYSAYGHRRFVLAAGYLADLLAARYATSPPGLSVEVVDTGLDTEKAARLRIVAENLAEDEFLVGYGDDVGDVDLSAVLDLHRRTDAIVTVTTVPLPSQFGTLKTAPDGQVLEFLEKPRLMDHWINAGFFVMRREALAFPGDDLESQVLPAIAAGGGLYAYRHHGFWKSMNTYKDRQELEEMAVAGQLPWLG